jgi:hypothetical protein
MTTSAVHSHGWPDSQIQGESLNLAGASEGRRLAAAPAPLFLMYLGSHYESVNLAFCVEFSQVRWATSIQGQGFGFTDR